VTVAAWLAFVFLLIATLALMVTPDAGSLFGLSNDAFAYVIRLVAVLIFVGGAVATFYRGRVSQAVKHFAIWTALLVAFVGGYAYRWDLARVANTVIAELRPDGSQINVYGANKAVKIKRAWSNHFIVTASITGQPVEMIVDTGASTVVLRHEDAKNLGLNMKALRYTVPVQTANGSSTAARVRLGDIFVGDVGLGNVEALVARQGSLHQSLLGMSFLSRLRSYEFSGDFLELRG
jgi:aspartyl protease family protein